MREFCSLIPPKTGEIMEENAQKDEKIASENLPKLTKCEKATLKAYFLNGCNQTEAYRVGFNCQNSSPKTVYENSSKLFNSTKFIPWLKYYEQNQAEAIQKEIRYSAVEHFNRLNYLQDIALNSHDKYGNVKNSDAIKIEELKGRLAGLYTDKHEVTGSGLADILKDLD